MERRDAVGAERPGGTLRCVIYVSAALEPFSGTALEQLLEDARSFNARRGVTGVLVYQDGNFFQYLEGLAQGVEAAYGRVRASRRHGRLIELLDAPVQERAFGSWHMGFTEPQRSDFLRLAQAEWLQAAVALQGSAGHEPGLRVLKSLRDNARR